MNDQTIPAAKLATAWGSVIAAFGVTSWAEAAGMAATLYTLCLLGEWVWKKVLRPLGERRGLLKRTHRRREDS